MLNISQRISTIASLVPLGARVCDIGTDHAYLPIYLLESDIAKYVIATDINKKPLLNAKRNLEKLKLNNYELRLCDGAANIKKGEADTFVIAGMGGEVISGIIERSLSLFTNPEVTVILQPTTSPEHLRSFLLNNGFAIKKEVAINENKKLYSVMLVNFCGIKNEASNLFAFIGLLSPKGDAAKLYIEKQYNRCLKCAKALKGNNEKQKEYLFYKETCEQISDFLKNFKE